MLNFSTQETERYQLLDELGEGGMATVYKAHDQRLEREVAIKFLRRGAFPPDQMNQILKRFEREAKSLARLSHPNIVKVHDFGEHEGAPYLVMEYLPGGTLKSILGKSVPWAVAMRMLIPVARALVFAHERGIVHRDVKPANIMISASGDPMLTDFGIAKLLENEDGKTLTGSGVGIGTPEYMAPEQGLGGAVDERVDIYSLGVVLYEMITGQKPYIADTPLAVVLKQINDPLPSPKIYAPDLPDAVEQTLMKSLAKKPEDRFENMNAFCKVMEELAGTPTLSTLAVNASADLHSAATQMVAHDSKTAETVKEQVRKRRYPIQWLGVIAAVLLIGLGVGVYYFRRPQDPPPATVFSSNESLPNSAPAQVNAESNLLPVEAQLTLGTINLEGTNLAITREQASALLPLWNNFKTLNQTIISNQVQNTPQQPVLDDAAQKQKNDLLQKIRAAMTTEQLNAIANMQLTEQSARTILQSKGVILNGASGGQSGGGFIGDLMNALIQILEKRAAG
jgi:serine/threonine protein kinase